MSKAATRIVLAHAGGLDTTAVIAWLAGRYRAEVVTLTLDLGQGGDLTEVRERALAAGAVRAHVIDAREEFVRDYLLPCLQSGAMYEHAMSSALARALIAKRLVDVARMESASRVAQGSGLDVAVRALSPSLTLITVPRGQAAAAPSDNANLWGRSIAADGPFTRTRARTDCPDEPAYLEIEFDAGVPIRANGIEMPMIELIESLEIIGGAHGVGRLDTEEAPAAVLLHAAHHDLEAFVMPSDLNRVKQGLAQTYAELVQGGRWFSPTREAIDAFVRVAQPRVTGSVRLKLIQGDCLVVDRTSPPADQENAELHHAAAEGLVS